MIAENHKSQLKNINALLEYDISVNVLYIMVGAGVKQMVLQN